ncbi:MAG: tRNA-intron lyase [Methanoregulaceae archaeon]|nr:tRNA-intron lyase [Methanoregulaceae archaeon]MCU0628529.1 tRNA-intron lyase [Methanoregulaceae archaeon]
MKARLDGAFVRLGSEGRSLYDQSGYGRPEEGGLRLAPEEACYLLYRKRIEIPGYDFDQLSAHFAKTPEFLRTFLVYRDLRERGYAVQTGPHDFRVFRRGQKPGSGQSQYMVRVLSERDVVDFPKMIRETTSSSHMRKQHVLAIVDDESELTYYEIKVQGLASASQKMTLPPLIGVLVGNSAIIHPSLEERESLVSFGMTLDDERLILSSLEIIYLARAGALSLRNEEGEVSSDRFYAMVADQDKELAQKAPVYANLRQQGYIPRTGYKFGHHFRVYSGLKPHSEMLVHAIAAEGKTPMSSISRSVRLAHSVKKKMLFAAQGTTGIQYVEFARIKL